MRQETSEWIAKAEGDFRTAWREWHVTDEPNFDMDIALIHQLFKQGRYGGKNLPPLSIKYDVATPNDSV